MSRAFTIGLDLGQSQDPTALAILKRMPGAEGEQHHYLLGYLKRYPLGTGYPDIVTDVAAIHGREEIQTVVNNKGYFQKSKPFLAVDATGVGRPVLDMLKKAKLNPTGIYIHGGDSVTMDKGMYRVPKRELCTLLQVFFQERRLQIAEGIPEADVLVKELLNFKVKISTSGHDSYEAWREGDHDDLVLATSMALWLAERKFPATRGRARVIEYKDPFAELQQRDVAQRHRSFF